MNDAVEVATDIFPLTVEEYENGDIGIVAYQDNVEVEQFFLLTQNWGSG